MTTRVMIDACAAERTSGLTRKQIDTLAIDIRDNGMRHPVLLLPVTGAVEKYLIVDGLARIAAASHLGHVTIEALVTSDLDQACDLLEESREDKELPPLRLFQLSEDLRPLLILRRSKNARLRRDGLPVSQESTRQVQARATGTPQHMLRHVRETFKRGLSGSPRARLLLEQYINGEVSLYYARKRIMKLPSSDRPEQVIRQSTKGQQNILAAAARAINTTLKTATDAAYPSHMPAEETEEVLKVLKKGRLSLARLIHTLEREKEQ